MTRRDAPALLAVAIGLALAGLSWLHGWQGGAESTTANPQSARGSGVLTLPVASREIPRRSVGMAPAAEGEPTGDRPPPARPGIPLGVRIPALGVTAAVSAVDSNGAGVLVPPADFRTVGWWAPGVRPGAKHGTAILAGHTVHAGGGAFHGLARMRPGQRVVVEGRRGDLTYRVSTVSVYRKGALAEQSSSIFAQDGPGRLALVTCADWDGSEYLSNVVVLATIPSRPSTR